MPTPALRLRFFARYAELVGCERLDLPVVPGETVGDLLARLPAHLPAAAALPEAPLVAVNQVQAALDHALGPGDEVALLPPLAGG